MYTKRMFVALAFAASTQALAATPILSPYPAPGGNTASGVGTATVSGGRTWTLGGFNSSMYDKLYYGVGDYPAGGFSAAGPSLTMDGSTDVLSFNSGQSNLAGGIAVWTGSTTFMTYNYGNVITPTRFTLKVTDLSGSALALTDASTIAGLPVSLGAVLDVQSDQPHAFHPNDLLVLEALADSIARAVEGARLYGDLRRRADDLPRSEVLGRYIIAAHTDAMVAAYRPLVEEMGADVVTLQVASLGQPETIARLGADVLPRLRALAPRRRF